MRVGAMAICVAASALLAPQAADAAWGVVTGAGALNLRSCASVDCDVVATMPSGAQVWIDGSEGGWYRVNYNGVVGYASGRYIAAAGGGTPPPQAQTTTPVRRPAPDYGSESGSGDDGY